MQNKHIIATKLLNPGSARGKVLKLETALSFWGGFDPSDGRIIDRSHALAGESISATILVLPSSKGSAGTPGGLAEALRSKVGPAAIILSKPDINLTVGAQVADFLYSTRTPVLTLCEKDFEHLQTGMQLKIDNERLTEELMS